MATSKLTIWCNMKFPRAAAEHLERGTRLHQLTFAESLQDSNLVSGKPDAGLLAADVAFGQPDPALLGGLPRLRWAHLTSAGYERYDRIEVKQALLARGAQLTNSSMVYEEPCAQHALAMMLSLSRQLPDSTRNQDNSRAWPAADIRARSHLLVGQSVLLAGFGAIGRRLVELLAPFRMRISAIRRTPRGDEPIPTFGEASIDGLLATADHVVNLLPGGESTVGFFSSHRLSLMKPSAIFYNIGRGATVDQEALALALKSGKIAAAYLDVMSPEPLPPGHALWQIPNCHITPHTAGGHHDEHVRLVQHFLDNLELFVEGKALRDRIV